MIMSYLFFKVKLKVYRPYFLQLNKKSTVNRQFKIYVPGNLKMHTPQKKSPMWKKHKFVLESTKSLEINKVLYVSISRI